MLLLGPSPQLLKLSPLLLGFKDGAAAALGVRC